MQPAIAAQGLSKRYYLNQSVGLGLRRTIARIQGAPLPERPEFWALKDIGFEVRRGESVGLIGPNGSGKSTLFKILAKITRQTEGRLRVNGRLSALIEVGAGFHPELSGRENIYLNGAILGMSRHEIDRKFDAIVAFAELEQFIDTPVKRYSSGMYVRLGFSIAAHLDPDILLIDEILAVGDFSFQRKCFERVREFRSQDRTFFLVSHNMLHIENVCDRVLYLKNGHLVADGPPSEVIALYLNQQDAQSQQRLQDGGHSRITTPILSDPERLSVSRVRTYDAQGRETDTLMFGEPLEIEVEYRATKPLIRPKIEIGVFGMGNFLAETNTITDPSEIEVLEGEGRVRCRIDPVLLTPGPYHLDLFVADGETSADLCHWQIAGEFRVAFPKDFRVGSGREGLFRFPAHWHSVDAQ